MPNAPWQKLAISDSLLGSCAPKSFDGTPMTTSPALFVTLPQRLQACVLLRVAAEGCRVDDKEHLALPFAERQLAALDGFELIGKGRRGGFSRLGRRSHGQQHRAGQRCNQQSILHAAALQESSVAIRGDSSWWICSAKQRRAHIRVIERAYFLSGFALDLGGEVETSCGKVLGQCRST